MGSSFLKLKKENLSFLFLFKKTCNYALFLQASLRNSCIRQANIQSQFLCNSFRWFVRGYNSSLWHHSLIFKIVQSSYIPLHHIGMLYSFYAYNLTINKSQIFLKSGFVNLFDLQHNAKFILQVYIADLYMQYNIYFVLSVI